MGGHPETKIAEFLNFDWYSPQYRSYHSEDELLRWYAEEGFGKHDDPADAHERHCRQAAARRNAAAHAPAGVAVRSIIRAARRASSLATSC